jgi:zinc transporter ZupT
MEVTLNILALIAAVPIGGLLVALVDSKSNDQIIKLMLAFSGGFLLSLAFIHFIPELYEHAHAKIGIYILIGFLIQLILEFFSGGIEHGHVHTSQAGKFPFALMIALSAHALLEGIPLGTELAGAEIATSHHHHDSENGLLMGILLHRIPVAIALATILFASGISKTKVWISLGIFALTTPLGLILGLNSVDHFNIDFNLILAVVVGMFLHISTTIIFETSENHKFNFIKLVSILGGAGLSFFIH